MPGSPSRHGGERRPGGEGQAIVRISERRPCVAAGTGSCAPPLPMTFQDAIETVGKGVDAVGVATMVVGVVVATVMSLRGRAPGVDAYRQYRQRVGRAILLGLELLVAADIIRTVAVTPTFESAGVLGIIVVIRTFLSFSLEVELEGRWPWQPKPKAVG